MLACAGCGAFFFSVGCGYDEAMFADHRGYQSQLIYVGAALQSRNRINGTSVANVRKSRDQCPNERALQAVALQLFRCESERISNCASPSHRTTRTREGPLRSAAVLATNNPKILP